MRHVEVDRTGRFFFYPSFFLGEGGRGSHDHSSGGCDVWVLWSTLYICHERCFESMDFFCVEAGLCFSCCHGEESALKGGRTPIFEGPYVVSAFWSWLGFSLGGPGVLFLFFLGREESLFLSFSSCWAGRALVRIRGCFFCTLWNLKIAVNYT